MLVGMSDTGRGSLIIDNRRWGIHPRARKALRFSGAFAQCAEASVRFSLAPASGGPLCENSRHLMEVPSFARWMDRFLSQLRISTRVHGHPIEKNALFVCNHISWLDTLVLSLQKPFYFVAKSEVGTWPMVGRISQRMKTLYIDRHRPFSVYRKLPILETLLRQGHSPLVFPEGTTTDMMQPLPFYPMMFEAAVRAQALVQPIALTYNGISGEWLRQAAYIEGDSVFDTLSRILDEPSVSAQLMYLPPISARGSDRRTLARKSHAAISEALLRLNG